MGSLVSLNKWSKAIYLQVHMFILIIVGMSCFLAVLNKNSAYQGILVDTSFIATSATLWWLFTVWWKRAHHKRVSKMEYFSPLSMSGLLRSSVIMIHYHYMVFLLVIKDHVR